MLGFAAVLSAEHELIFLSIERIDGCLLLIISEGLVIDSKGFVLLCESVTDDIPSEGPAVGFPALETAGLEFPAWEPDKLFKFVTDQGGEIDI